VKGAFSMLCFCFHNLNRNGQLLKKSYITCAKVQSKHMLNTNEHWINAIDFIGTFEINIFESWQNTHFNTTPNYIHKHVNHDLAIFCRVFSFQIANLWKHKSYTQPINKLVGTCDLRTLWSPPFSLNPVHVLVLF